MAALSPPDIDMDEVHQAIEERLEASLNDHSAEMHAAMDEKLGDHKTDFETSLQSLSTQMDQILSELDNDLNTVSSNFEHTQAEITKLNEKVNDLEKIIMDNQHHEKIESLEKQLEEIKGVEVNHQHYQMIMDNIKQVREDINKSSYSKSAISGRTEVISMKPVSKVRSHLESQYLQSLGSNSDMVDEKYYKNGKRSAISNIQGKYLHPFGPSARTSKMASYVNDKKSSPG